MRTQFIFWFIFIFGFCNCTDQNLKEKDSFKKHIKFDHLYVVIDDSSYFYLMDSLKILNDFSEYKEKTTDAGDVSWSGKYFIGKNHYLEIFKPGGAPGAKFGDFGIGFMPNKLGVLDSLQNQLKNTRDSIVVTNREYVDNGKSYPWFRAISFPDPDSLRMGLWLMEYENEFMLDEGFTKEELSDVIDGWDRNKKSIAKQKGIAEDSINYLKAFEKVTSLFVTVSNKELSMMRQHLLAFGFTEENNTFISTDFKIIYTISESEHFMLDQIDFSLSKRIPEGKYQYKKLELNVEGLRASLKFLYN